MADDYIGINIDPATKQEWRDYIDENPGEYESLTQLIIKSVTREMKGLHKEAMIPPDKRERVEANVDLTPVEDELTLLNDRIAALTTEVRELEVAASEGDPEVLEVMNVVHEMLPLVDDHEEFYESYDDPSARPPEYEPHQTTGDPEDIARALNKSDKLSKAITEGEVQRACARLDNEPNDVYSHFDDSTMKTHYYRVRT